LPRRSQVRFTFFFRGKDELLIMAAGLKGSRFWTLPETWDDRANNRRIAELSFSRRLPRTTQGVNC